MTNIFFVFSMAYVQMRYRRTQPGTDIVKERPLNLLLTLIILFVEILLIGLAYWQFRLFKNDPNTRLIIFEVESILTCIAASLALAAVGHLLGKTFLQQGNSFTQVRCLSNKASPLFLLFTTFGLALALTYILAPFWFCCDVLSYAVFLLVGWHLRFSSFRAALCYSIAIAIPTIF
jgi:hypothetical protein